MSTTTTTPNALYSNAPSCKKVAILGAGVAGLQVANELTEAGMTCSIFDKADDVGGVWRNNYADFGLQVPKELYEFPGFPWREALPKEKIALFPSGPQVQRYIQAFAKHRGLYELCRFNTAIIEMAPLADAPEEARWRVTYQAADAAEESEVFDYCVVCSGMYSTPSVPSIPDADLFKGLRMHAGDFDDAQAASLAGKRVLVVGSGKSAIDCAVAAAKTAEDTTLLFRKAHWPVPRYLCNLVPFKWGTYSRFGHTMLPAHHEMSRSTAAMHAAAKPAKWAWWRTVELMFRVQFGLKKELVPKTPIEKDVFNGGQILSYEFRNMLRNKKAALHTKLGAIDRFTETGVVLRGGEEVPVDVVVFGTGFTKSYHYLPQSVQDQLALEDDGHWLYRNVLPTAALPGLAFVGAETSTFNNVLTQGLQAAWLRAALTGDMQLPPREAMAEHLEREKAWKRSWMPPSHARASILQLHMTKYHDLLCKDMKLRHRRKNNIIAETFAPYSAADYEAMFRHNHVAVSAAKPQPVQIA